MRVSTLLAAVLALTMVGLVAHAQTQSPPPPPATASPPPPPATASPPPPATASPPPPATASPPPPATASSLEKLPMVEIRDHGFPAASTIPATAIPATTAATIPAAAFSAAAAVLIAAAAAPTVTSTDPHAGANDVPLTATIRVTFSTPMEATTTAAAFSIAPAVIGSLSLADATTLVFTPASLLPNDATFVVGVNGSAMSIAGIPLAGAIAFNFTTSPHPYVVAMSPAPHDPVVAPTAPIVLTFTAPMNQAATLAAFSTTPALPGTVSHVWNAAGTVLSVSHTGLFGSTSTYSVNVSSAATSAAGVALAPPFGADFTVVSVPIVTAFYPPNGQTGVAPSETVVVHFSRAMDTSQAETAFFLSGPTGNVTGAITWLQSGSVLVFTPAADLVPGSMYTAAIGPSARDLAGVPLYRPYTASFSVASPPIITSSLPANNSASVSVFASVAITFSQAMAPDTTTAAFSLTPHAPVACAMANDNHKLVCVPTLGLSSSTVYVAALAPTAISLAGDRLAGPHTIIFSTEGAPSVASVDPADGATGVSVVASIAITFTTPMATSATAAAFALYPSSGGPADAVAGVASWSTDKTRLTFDLAGGSQLGSDTSYSVLVGPGARSEAGTPLQGGTFASTFTTVTVPQLLGATPAAGAADLPSGAPLALALSFNVAMNSGSLAAATVVTIFDQTRAELGPLNGTLGCNGEAKVCTFSSISPLDTLRTYRVDVSAAAEAADGTPLAAPISFLLSTSGIPVASSTSPAAHSPGADPLAALSVTFTQAMAPAPTGGAIQLFRGTNTSAPVAGLGAPVWSSGDTMASMAPPPGGLAPGTIYTLTVGGAAVGSNGALLRSEVIVPFVTWTPPVVTFVAPRASSPTDRFPRSSSLQLQFSEPMDVTSLLSGGLVCLSHPDLLAPDNVTVAWSLGDTYVQIGFVSGLGSGINYTLALEAGALRAASGAPLTVTYTWSFTTLITPHVTAVTPADGTDSVPLRPQVTVDFSVSMIPSSVFAAFSVAPSNGGKAVLGYAHFAASSQTLLVWTPQEDLVPGTTYTARVASTATSAAGARLPAEVTWSFTVTGVPRVLAVSPADGTSNVWATSAIELTFSREMDRASTLAALQITPALDGATVAWSETSRQLRLTPDARGLALDARYSLELSTQARGSNGLNLTVPFVSSFTTSRLDPFARCSDKPGILCGECQFISPSCAYNFTSGTCQLGYNRAQCALPASQCFDKYRLHTSIGYGVGGAALALVVVGVLALMAMGLRTGLEAAVVMSVLLAVGLGTAALAVPQWRFDDESPEFAAGVDILVVTGLFSGKLVTSSAAGDASSGCTATTIKAGQLTSEYKKGSYIAATGLALSLVAHVVGVALLAIVKREASGYFSFASEAAERRRKRLTPFVFCFGGLAAGAGIGAWLGISLDSGSIGVAPLFGLGASGIGLVAGLALAWSWRPSRSGYVEFGDAMVELDPNVHYALK
ncbi:uncharacterized protein AMSG_06589 [Thecamonas trahens ATCC 50062]|uniref:SbsA Ig-like domain-containing protein n=1 Tax=Thecamonas trahens ATCC 50062 TaxID=461836 RepID=A0A0L0DGI6_THETB|nr:hypothetical protein AMSG_06589 [Thecamonas trahens ATCC 50062]KNC51231.1 hypothetical protein AMSG_06589 [Thecamonas trahens ATCC 50062]|eukprot:XP_013756425.1 hypothetical protein AMSG_06589 [Thecamonas trahens ATCC 50062]